MILSAGCPPWPPDQTSDPAEDRRSYTTPRDMTLHVACEFKPLQGCLGVGRLDDLEPCLVENISHEHADEGFIIHHKNFAVFGAVRHGENAGSEGPFLPCRSNFQGALSSLAET